MFNKKNLISNILITLCIIAVFGAYYHHSQDKRRVMVIHSYSTDLTWVNDINLGLESAFGEDKNTQVRYHYMDLKNNNHCSFYHTASKNAHLAIKQWQPEVIIIADDIGQALIGSNYLKGLSTIDEEKRVALALNYLKGTKCPRRNKDAMYFNFKSNTDREIVHSRDESPYLPYIVFAGLNGGFDNYGYGLAQNVAGVFEHKNFSAINDAFHELYKGSAKANSDGDQHSVQVLNDNSSTARSEHEKYVENAEAYRFTTITNAETFSEWIEALARAEQNGEMILMANYASVLNDSGTNYCDVNAANKIKQDGPQDGAKNCRTNELVTYTETVHPLPVLGANTNFVQDGGMLTIAISGREQGKTAAGFAKKWLEDPVALSNAPFDEKFKEPHQYLIGMNYGLVERRKIKLNSIYKAFSSEIGQLFYFSDHLYIEKQVMEPAKNQ